MYGTMYPNNEEGIEDPGSGMLMLITKTLVTKMRWMVTAAAMAMTTMMVMLRDGC